MRLGAAALALLLALGGCAQFRRSTGARDVVLPMREGYVTADDGAKLFFRVIGSGRDTVLVVHGGPGVHMGYLANLEPLAAAGTLIFYDQRGGGRSSLPALASQLTVARHVSDLDEVRRHFSLNGVTVLGHSWGGLLAALYAVEHPTTVRRLILAAPIPVRGEPFFRFHGAVMPTLLGPDSARYRLLVAAWDTTSDPLAACREFVPLFARALGSDTGTIRRVTTGACTVHPDAIRRGLTTTRMWTMQSLGMWDLRPRLRSITARTLVIAGARDPSLTPDLAREWVAALPNARLEIMPAAGHYVFFDDPVRFATLVREFLGRD